MKKIFLLLIIVAIYPLNIIAQTATADPGVIINGVKWATRNVGSPGTFVEKPEDLGMFYQWNSPVGWSITDPITPSDGKSTWHLDWDGDETSDAMTWMTTKNVCPSGWRVPTLKEFRILIDAGSKMVKRDRVFGNGNDTILLPAAGYREYKTSLPKNVGLDGYYWTSTITGTDTDSYHIYFSGGYLKIPGHADRGSGFSIRCVDENYVHVENTGKQKKGKK